MNILKMKAEDARKLIDEILDNITKEELVKELQDSGFNVTDADKMLKDMGYIKDESFGGVASYILPLHHLYKKKKKCVDFNEDKTVSIHVDDYNVNATAHLYIWNNTPQEIEAIYTKIKELGWI